jgi:hypothetical protein
MIRLFFFIFLINTLALQAKHIKLNLQNAIKQRLVKVSANSLGGYQGLCMNMRIQNIGKDSLLVLVEAGRCLNSIDDKQQDILIVKEELICLKQNQSKSFLVKGYCCQSSHRAPQLNAVYAPNQLADSSLVLVARFLNKNCFSKDIEQYAIWAISDKKPIANIPNKNDTSNLNLRQLLAKLKGEKLPWYTILNATYVSQTGDINTIPTNLVAILKYNNEQHAYATLTIFDANSHQVCLIKSEWLKQGNNIEYAINLPIKNLAKGKYNLVLQTREKEVLKESFEI